MSREDWTQALGEAGREQAREVDVWWDAVERGDVSLLPSGAPPIETLRPIDDAERARLAADLFERVSAPTPLVRRRRTWIAGVTAMAIAATVAAIALRAPPPHVSSYSMLVSGGDKAWRSSEAPPPSSPQYRTGSRLEIVLQPETATEAAPEVFAELVGKRTVAWPTPIERGREGTFRLVAELGTELVLEPGLWRLVVVVGRAPDSGQRLEYRFEVIDGS